MNVEGRVIWAVLVLIALIIITIGVGHMAWGW